VRAIELTMVHAARNAYRSAMRKTTVSIAAPWAVMALLAGSSCKRDDGSASEGSARPASGSASNAAASSQPKKDKPTCADWGGEGSLDRECVLKGKSPFKAKWTGAYVDSFGRQVPEFEVESSFELEVSWGYVATYYYDKDGKQLELNLDNGYKAMHNYENGSGLLKMKPGETKKLGFGVTKEQVPAGTETIEAEITGWGVETPVKKFFAVEVEDYKVRPKGGWK
jgi:hypothetical protein